jgi:hypothetical protein
MACSGHASMGRPARASALLLFAAAFAGSALAQIGTDAEPSSKPSTEDLARLKQNPVSGLR